MTEQPIKEKKGMLFDIQRFSINDGPGIRTNLFFKGCPLRCKWCHNPESYLVGKQLSFISSACVGCMACVKACPNGANQVQLAEGKQYLSVDYKLCNACGKCIDVCCYNARSIIGREYTAQELLGEVLIDKEYYKIGEKEGQGGGITLTGGEPMLQFDFIDHFLNSVEDIHVCMETSGYAPTWQYEKLLGKVDLFLFDYKVSNPSKHKELCGVDNRLILKNLEYLCEQNVDIILRIPLIPGTNDDEEHLRETARIIKKHSNIRHGEIMAYHNLGVSKADNIGLCNKVLEQENATKEQKELWLQSFHNNGVENIKLG